MLLMETEYLWNNGVINVGFRGLAYQRIKAFSAVIILLPIYLMKPY